MRVSYACLVVIFVFIATVPQAQIRAQDSEEESAGELAREGIENLLRALGSFIDMIPQYEAPELNENGDIIIRRKPKRKPPPVQNPDLDETRT